MIPKLFSRAAAATAAEGLGILSLIGQFELGQDEENLPEEVPVSSTCIASIGFDGESVITVTFHRGGTYAYAGSRDLFEMFKAARSKGQFFNQWLR